MKRLRHGMEFQPTKEARDRRQREDFAEKVGRHGNMSMTAYHYQSQMKEISNCLDFDASLPLDPCVESKIIPKEIEFIDKFLLSNLISKIFWRKKENECRLWI